MLLTAEDFELEASRRLPPEVFSYLAGGAEQEITLARNRAQWAEIGLLPRHMRNLAGGTAARQVLGARIAFPALVAPMAFQRLACNEGEAAMRMAAAAQGIGMVLSCQTSVAPEDLPQAPGPVWFQLYLQPDPQATRAMAARALAAGAEALVVSIDAPINGLRNREIRAGFRLPEGVEAVMMPPLSQQSVGESLVFDGLMALAPVWADLAALCTESPVPVLAKGVLRPGDATLAVRAGCAGIIVSNHGGRVLDGVPGAADVLPAIRALHPRLPILADGGIRQGSDIFKALALGADAVLIGRPAYYGLAVDGARGASQILRRLREEFEVTMALCGCRSPEEIGADALYLKR
jgi:4-hydroxymandelate oxidase